MDVLSDQQVTAHTRKRWRGYEREALKEKLILF